MRARVVYLVFEVINESVGPVPSPGGFFKPAATPKFGVCNVCHAPKTRYTRYTVDGQRFKVLHFRYTGCYTLLHFVPADKVS